ncbi:MAG: glucose-6-phosphate isomerase [Phycisphaerales bacterium]|nr:glucose-6-phosphate isomerase [Phycisphaerales bacterium]
MASTHLQLDYGNVLTAAVGATHGLSAAEIKRAEGPVRDLVKRIETERKTGAHRYRDLPQDATMLKAVRRAVQRYAGRFENLVVLGIGGSALGNIALQTALNSPYHNLLPARQRRGPRLFVLDNVDPVQISELVDLLGPALRKTLFNVISKSGETAETAAQFQIVRELLLRKLGRKGLVSNTLVTTDPEGGTLRGLATETGFDTLEVPPGVGGRFSVLSAVGLFSAGLCGIRIERLLAGAAKMGARVAQPQVRKNPAAMLALLLHAYYVRGKRLHVMMPYSYALKDLADWYRQLWAESLGKQQDRDGQPVVVGPTPIKALGATDQHSQVQLYREGPNDKVFIFLEVERFARDVKIPKIAGTPEPLLYLQGKTLGRLLNAEKAATEHALVASARPCLTLRFPTINEETVGQFILLWEAATTIMGGLLNIDPYDQPAVQLGKDYTYALMGKSGYAQQARELKRATLGGGKFVV